MSTARWWKDVRVRTLILVNVAAIVERADESLLPAVYNEVGRAFHASPKDLGALTLVRALVQALVCPLSPWLSLYMPRVHIIASGALIWGLATLAVGLATSYRQVAWLRGLNGIGLALVFPPIQSLIADLASPTNRGVAFGWLQFMTYFGDILGYSIGITLAGIPARTIAILFGFGMDGWRMAFLVVAAISLLLAAFISLFAQDSPRQFLIEDLSNEDARRRCLDVDSLADSCIDGSDPSSATQPLLFPSHATSPKPTSPASTPSTSTSSKAPYQPSTHTPSPVLSPTTPSSPSSPHSSPLSSPHHPPPSSPSFLSDLSHVLRTPSFLIIVAQGIVGSFAWASLTFLPMWLELVGFSHPSTALLLSSFTASCSFGGLFAGWFGDWMSATWRDSGRVICAQISAGSAVVMSTVLLRVVPQDTRFFWVYFCVLVLMGFLISWNDAASNNPIFADIVPERLRTDIYALDRAFEMSVAAFAPPTVGFLAQAWFGFQPSHPASPPAAAPAAAPTAPPASPAPPFAPPSPPSAADPQNAKALSLGLFWTMAAPFALCCALYGGLYWTYPKDRDKALAEAAEEARKGQQHHKEIQVVS
ncbi:hypothetical protein CLOM_g12802 [Closterium sp. NIES-68]|nr:hypothetical protein CLOM_g12802 [Closterium sp. NIES-68]GJP82529.1 hypothetical protein CLOP_g12775 [Closterium sp. NIES-67]